MEVRIDEIVQLEWEDFQNVNNAGGRASCQDDRATFAIMRKSQFLAWDEATCESYLNDLLAARAQGRNLLMEKYARMMADSSPLEYERLQDFLPPLSDEAVALAKGIAAAMLAWQREYAAAFPRLSARGRSVNGGGVGRTGFESYLCGELATYSAETLRRLASHVETLREQGVNMSVRLMEHTVRMYGYRSLAEAEAGA